MKRPTLGLGGLTAFRAALLVVAIVVGVVVLTKAFPSDASRGVVGPPAASVRPSASASIRPSARPSPTRSPRVRGVTVQVLNGTTKTGLAASESQQLQSAGYTMKPPGDAPNSTRTTIYYKPGFAIEAAHLRDTFFPHARLRVAPSTVAADIDLSVVLGEDFVATPTP